MKKDLKDFRTSMNEIKEWASVIGVMGIASILYEYITIIMGISKRDWKQHGKEIMEQLIGELEYEGI